MTDHTLPRLGGRERSTQGVAWLICEFVREAAPAAQAGSTTRPENRRSHGGFCRAEQSDQSGDGNLKTSWSIDAGRACAIRIGARSSRCKRRWQALTAARC
ncbi:MAG: hypothetical protein U0X75_15525 [Acidobacteriota bacterium]